MSAGIPVCSAFVVLAVSAPLAFTSPLAAGDDPYADMVISYSPGSSPSPAPGYTNPAVALGSPERFTGELVFPQTVTAFQGAFGTNEIVSLGGGGSLVVKFNTPVMNDPANAFGVDLIVFGNSYFIDAAYPSAIVAGINAEGGTIEVSANGVAWTPVPGAQADGPWPTIGWVDADPYALAPGRSPTDFTQPVDPSLTLADFIGASYKEVLSLYEGSGGGRGIDIGALGLSEVSYVRIANPAGATANIEIDAFSDVAPLPVFGDLNGDGHVNGLDLAILLAAWGLGSGPADLNHDGQVNGLDLARLLASWTG